MICVMRGRWVLLGCTGALTLALVQPSFDRRLSVLAALLCLAPLTAWLLGSSGRPRTVPTTVVLAGGAVVTCAYIAYFAEGGPPAQDALLVNLLAATVAWIGGVAVDVRRYNFRSVLLPLPTWLLVVACCAGGVALSTADNPGFIPSAHQLLPLPAGLSARRTDATCGANGSFCDAEYVITSTVGSRPAAILDTVVAHLVHEYGWPEPPLRSQLQQCRNVGLIRQNYHLCVWVLLTQGAVTVLLTGAAVATT